MTGSRGRSLLKHYATSQTVMDSSPYEVTEFCSLSHPSSRTRFWDLVSLYQKWVPVTKIKNGSLSRAWPVRENENLAAIFEPII
jgi:hypothetical protein